MISPAPIDAIRPGLAAPLFGTGDFEVYAVLSGASAKDLLKKLYEHEPDYACLYRGELQADIAAVAPYLVRLETDSPFTEWFLGEGWGLNCGILIQSTANLRTLRNHFREFIRAELPDRRTVLFRYYDPRIFRSFVAACNASELARFFGPVHGFVVEAETPDAASQYSLVAGALKTQPITLKKIQPK